MNKQSKKRPTNQEKFHLNFRNILNKKLAVLLSMFVLISAWLPSSMAQSSGISLSSISPNYGSTAGSTNVTINGSGFVNTDSFSTTSTWTATSGFPSTSATNGSYAGRSFVQGDYIYYVGGTLGSSYDNKIYKASITNPTSWSDTGLSLKIGTINLPLSAFGMVKNGNYLYLYGGLKSATIASNRVYQVDISNIEGAVSNPASVTTTDITTSDSAHQMTSRYWVSSVLVGNYIYLFGGTTTSGVISTSGETFYYATLDNPGYLTKATSSYPGYNFPPSYSVPVVRIGNYLFLFGNFTGSTTVNDTNRTIYYSYINNNATTGISDWNLLTYSGGSNILMPQVGSTTPVSYVSNIFAVIGDTVYGFGGAASGGTRTNAIFSANISSLLGAITPGMMNPLSVYVPTMGGFSGLSSGQALIINKGTSSVLLLLGFFTGTSGSTSTYTAPITYNRGNKYNPSWLTNWRTDQSGITFGGTPVFGFTYANSSQISARTPAHTAGLVDVVYTAPDGTTASLNTPATQYEYYNSALTPGYAGAPTNLQATAGNGQIALSWTAPSNTGNLSIRNYKVYYKATGGTIFTPWEDATSTNSTVTGLTNGTSYDFMVAAYNSLGTGSTAYISASPYTTPSSPSSFTATSGDKVMNFSWTAPSNGGSPITGYTIKYKDHYSSNTYATLTTAASDATSISVSASQSFVVGTNYDFIIIASTAAGNSIDSDIANATLASVPNPPVQFHISAGDSSVDVYWGESGSSGGSPVTGFVMRYKPTGSTESSYTYYYSQYNYFDNPYTVSNLTNGTSYDFQVASINAIGTGEYTTTLTATPVGNTSGGSSGTGSSAQGNINVSCNGDGSLQSNLVTPDESGTVNFEKRYTNFRDDSTNAPLMESPVLQFIKLVITDDRGYDPGNGNCGTGGDYTLQSSGIYLNGVTTSDPTKHLNLGIDIAATYSNFAWTSGTHSPSGVNEYQSIFSSPSTATPNTNTDNLGTGGWKITTLSEAFSGELTVTLSGDNLVVIRPEGPIEKGDYSGSITITAP